MTMRDVSEAEAAQADFLVCLRVADLPPISRYPADVQGVVRETRQRSVKANCQGCNERILVDTAHPTDVPPICTHCHNRIKDTVARAQAASRPGRPS